MIDFNQFINENLNEAKKFYTTKEIVKLSNAAGDWVPDAKFAIQDLAVAYGDKVPAKELDKILTNYDLEIEDLMESINEGRKVTLKRRYTENHPAITAGKHARIRNKMLEAIGDGKITQEEFDNILKELSSNSKKWSRNNAKYFNVSEEGISLSKFGRRALASITINEEQPEVNKKPLEMKINESKFNIDDIVYNKRTKTVGIVRIADDEQGEVKTDADGNVNVDELEKYNPIKFKHQTKAKVAPSTEKEIISKGLFNPFKNESITNEAASRTAIEIAALTGTNKNFVQEFIDKHNLDIEKVFQYVKKGKLADRMDFVTAVAGKDGNPIQKKLIKQFVNEAITEKLSKDKKIDGKWYSFQGSHKFEPKALAIANREWGSNMYDTKVIKDGDKYSVYVRDINEATTKNPEVWVPGAFDKELSKMPNSKITYNIVKDLAKKHKVFLDDAIAYVEYGWGLDLQENKNNQMKSNFIYESFNSFVENELNEAFKSSKLASLFRNTSGQIDKKLAQAFYDMSRIKMDQVEDHDIIEMDPKKAYKDKRNNAVYFYFTRNEKENPYATSEYADDRRIPANTLLAITNGRNKFYGISWRRFGEKGYVMSLGTPGDSAGIDKSNSKYGGTGLSNMKRVSDVADVAYVMDLDILRNRYDVSAIRDTRSAAQKGAIAFKTNKEFKQENLNRYNTIIANRAAKMPIDKMVKDAIDTISAQIKDALDRGEKTRYNEILIGRSSKGREAKLQDAANHMQRILDDFQRYVSYTNQAEEEKKAGYSGDYYARKVKNYAKSITDRIKQIDNFGYAW